MYEMLASLITDENLVLKEGLMLLDFKTFAEYEKEKEEEAEREEQEKKEQRLAAALELYNSHKGSTAFKTQLVFKNGQVVDEIFHRDGAELMPTDTYEYPPYTPAYGDHPRILVTKDKVPEILKLLEDPRFSPLEHGSCFGSRHRLTDVPRMDFSCGVNGRRALYYLLSVIMPNGNMFQTGDATNGMGHLPSGQTYVEWNWMLAAEALTDDPVILSYAYKYSAAQGKYDFSMTEHITPTLFAILAASCSTWDQLGEVDFSLGLIQYNGFPGGQPRVGEAGFERYGMYIGGIKIEESNVFDK